MTFDVFAELVYRIAETLGGSNFGDAPTGNPANVQACVQLTVALPRV
jgi:hypothetical protein